ncbi:hypothetical protein ND861_19245 [Leptospira sp. 2 VSF19]|uniref:Lipoprotein n=1 Tax=Leptospira soteropolitanensis TaxID=2950025 RepID=A0AAW5VMJ0_9LEPT|nr:hypothetical protein [Leptospira soteropolitanensis]MCW7494801.1 hypothetical protein [Leptospira soteropolitanensis]MCW7502395.1 hypothetical protein [Leptospira soteropolitanensis]MCW7524628.1 hypothetical protein [Leptospira soteropolitanensis]MCW7528501.1 hypothetical protein [Leptospira soteropolitanensis]MCW7532364.1 hypothetical protein [Leptospira soteropolitanensis]
MKIKYLIVTLLLIGCFEKKEKNDETIISSIISPDKQIRIDFINSDSNPICENKPASLSDSGKIQKICFFRIFDNNTNKLILELNPESDKTKNKELIKCTPENYPLSVAYGFIKLNINNEIIFEDNYAIYGSSGEFSKIIKFNWKKCIFTTIAEFEEGNIGWPDPEGKIYFYLTKNQIYAFLTLKSNNSFRIIKTQANDKNKYSNFFSNEQNDLKEDVQILYQENFNMDEKDFPEWKFNFPYFKANLNGKEIKFNLETDKIEN